jgi:hypothetical protein
MMKRCVPIFVMLLFGLWLGCGGKEKGPTDNGEKPQRLVANTTVDEPTLDSVNDPVWSTIDSVVVPVSQAGNPKLRPPDAAAVPPNVTVKAVKKSDKLYLRLQWSDATFDAYFENYEVDHIIPGTPQAVWFKHNDSDLTQEDQIFVLFDGLPEGGYDVWNWRVLTTGAIGLGKGFNYLSADSLLVADSAGTVTDFGIITNPERDLAHQPTYAHKNSSDFHGYLLYTTDTVNYQQVLDSIYDEYLGEWVDVFFFNTTGWQIGQKIPGWLIDSSLALSDEQLGSRWDIKSVSEYDSTADYYQVVLCRKLYTTFTDDMDLSAVDSVKVKIGIYDSQEEFDEQTNHRGFSDVFWIILP